MAARRPLADPGPTGLAGSPTGQPNRAGPRFPADAADSGRRAGPGAGAHLQDAVTVAILARELAAAQAGNGQPEGGDPR